MKASTIVKIGIGISAACAAALTFDNTMLSKKNRQLAEELEQAKSSPAHQPAPESTTRVYDDPEDQIEADFYNRAFELENRMLDLAERKIKQAEEAEARKEARRASKAQAKAEAKAARKAAKAKG